MWTLEEEVGCGCGCGCGGSTAAAAVAVGEAAAAAPDTLLEIEVGAEDGERLDSAGEDSVGEEEVELCRRR